MTGMNSTMQKAYTTAMSSKPDGLHVTQRDQGVVGGPPGEGGRKGRQSEVRLTCRGPVDILGK